MATRKDNKKIVTNVKTAKELRALLRERDIADSITAFARLGGCSRQSIYGALRFPERYPLVHRRIKKVFA